MLPSERYFKYSIITTVLEPTQNNAVLNIETLVCKFAVSQRFDTTNNIPQNCIKIMY